MSVAADEPSLDCPWGWKGVWTPDILARDALGIVDFMAELCPCLYPVNGLTSACGTKGGYYCQLWDFSSVCSESSHMDSEDN